MSTTDDKRPVISNCQIGLGVKITPQGYIHVDPAPIRPGYDGPALREHMRTIIDAWTEQLKLPEAEQ